MKHTCNIRSTLCLLTKTHQNTHQKLARQERLAALQQVLRQRTKSSYVDLKDMYSMIDVKCKILLEPQHCLLQLCGTVHDLQLSSNIHVNKAMSSVSNIPAFNAKCLIAKGEALSYDAASSTCCLLMAST